MAASAPSKRAPASAAAENPLLQSWETPFQMPPFSKIKARHFVPAFEKAMATHAREMKRIANAKAAPTFTNTIAAMERSGEALSRTYGAFGPLAGAHTNPDLQAAERELAPRFAAHFSAIKLDADLFKRVKALHKDRAKLKLSDEQRRVLERTYESFVRDGALLKAKDKKRLAEIDLRLASLGTAFSQNVLADESGWTMVLDTKADLKGLPPAAVAAARQAASDHGHEGKYVITLARSSVETFLKFSARRDLRERAFKAWAARGANGGETDNHALIAEMVSLRAQRASLLGFDSYAAYRLDNTMAKTPENVRALLDDVWARAKVRAKQERDALQALVHEEGGNFEIEPWDWRYYAERLRKALHNIDETKVKPYLQLEHMIEAAFDTATRLFGVTFKERKTFPKYHPDVRAWEVRFPDGRAPALFVGDYFARSSKRSGAWMSAMRSQSRVREDIRPIIYNVMNFSKPAAGEPALLSFDDARTLFHEFGHALHGLLSDVTYPSIAGTAVSRDFVELPSQLFEHWLMQPKVLEMFARHADSEKPMPKALLKKIKAAETFDQGFATVEYTACALVDLELHALDDVDADFDVAAFEAATLKRLGMPREIIMRHRLPHFQHLFSGGGYAAGYYSYMWSEVMDADAFEAFEEAGDIYDAETAKRLHDHIYAAGNRRDPEEAYVAFRGRAPKVDALLKGRGLADAA